MAGFTIAAKNEALGAFAGVNPTNVYQWLSLHSADPLLTGANEIVGGAYIRQQVTWSAAANAQLAGSQVSFNVPAGTTIQYWGCWTAQSNGSFGFGEILPVSETYPSNGLYLLTVTLTATG